MATTPSTSPPKNPEPAESSKSSDDSLEVNKELEQIIEDVENMAVQLTWMAYDMVALRTNPELVVSIQKLKDASERCKATVFGEKEQQ